MFMNRRNRNRAGFTLLELVVVLAILATVTLLAIRAVDGVQDRHRFEASDRLLHDIEKAVLGSPDDRAPDGTPSLSGFVADMGRLPKARLNTAGALDLGELWDPTGLAPYTPVPSTPANTTPPTAADRHVILGRGWRGPYLRLPSGAPTLLDGWGNPIVSPPGSSPPDPHATGYARLRTGTDAPVTTPGDEIRMVRLLGANGRFDPADTGTDVDRSVDLSISASASLAVQIEVLTNSIPPTPEAPDGSPVVVRVFGTDPTDSSKIAVTESPPVPLTVNPVTCTLTGLTPGPRVVRAYRLNGPATVGASPVRPITLPSGASLLSLTIHPNYALP